MLVKYCNLAREHVQQESAKLLTEFVLQVKRKMIKLDRPSKDESWLNPPFLSTTGRFEGRIFPENELRKKLGSRWLFQTFVIFSPT